ncbi:MAG: DUF6311 domain-containing protein, partial [Elioraea sp.]|nr:DUF6311 domain-containing protein [Elioraea sp.]
MRPRPTASALSVTIAILIGGTLPLLAYGPRILDPGDIGWMLAGPLGPDPVAYWIAWTYFRSAPWLVPPGLNPDWGLELGSSIFYADVIPLLAFLLKALRGVVAVEQYWGAWLVVCGALQAAAAWALLGRATEDPVARGAGAVVFVAQPMMLNRMGGHFALAAHWLLVAALALALRPPPARAVQAPGWAGLLAVAALVQSYLLAMVAALWAADLIDRLRRDRRLAWTAVEAALVIGVTLAALWAAGFFVLRGAPSPIGEGYGMTALDLLAPFDAAEWGRFLPELPTLRHWEHGGSYLGLGALLLLGAAAVAAISGPFSLPFPLGRHAVLMLALLGLLAFAVGNRPALAGTILFEIPLPEPVRQLADLLRASERFVWPLSYAALFAAVAVVSARWRGRTAAAILLLAAPVQLADVSVGLERLRGLVAEAPREPLPRLADPFWQEAAERYARLRAVPAENLGAHWEPLARLAAAHRLATDAVYLARVDRRA